MDRGIRCMEVKDHLSNTVLTAREADLSEGKKPVDDSWGADDPEFYGKLVTVEGENEIHETD